MDLYDSSQTIGGVKERAGCISKKIERWATHVAILSPEYIKCAARQEPAESVRKRWHVRSKLSFRRTEDNYILVLMQQPGGWVVQRSSGGSGFQTLFNILGDMPILCPMFEAAAQLAEACHPIPLTVLQWRTDSAPVRQESAQQLSQR